MKYDSLDQLFNDIHEPFKPAVKKIRQLFLSHQGVQEMLQWNAFVYKRWKWNRAYINVYKKKKVFYVGFGQWAAMVKYNPMLRYAFDEVKEVVAKIEVKSPEDVEKKSLAELIQLAIHYSKSKKWED